MVPYDVLESLAERTPSKIVLLVIDGLGGLPKEGRTELEAADCPCLDKLAADSEVGLSDPVGMGITPGSGPSHLALFGYDPLRFDVGRGVLEALGVGLEMTSRDVACRGNLATLDESGTIISRRGGQDAETRISPEEGPEVSQFLADKIKKVRDVDVILKPGKEHRFTVLFRREGLDGRLADADPQQVGEKPLAAEPLHDEAKETADLVNEFVRQATELLGDRDHGNTVLLRGFTKYPSIPSMTELFKLTPAAIAVYPMYRGLAQLVGMKVLDAGETVADEFETLEREYAHHDFFYLHIKKTDSYGEDGDFLHKVSVIEEVDKHLPTLLSLEPDVIAVTADHSTPALMKAHSWHPCPFLLWSKYCHPSGVERFTERDCAGGALGRFPAVNAMPMLLANALKLAKYGA